MTDINDIWKFELRRGNSNNPRDGACLLDAVSWLEYGTLGDHPPCVCPVIAAFGRGINDAMSDAGRQKLKAYIPQLVGTVDRAHQQERAEYLAWQAIRVFAPIALDAANLHGQGTALRCFVGSLSKAVAAARAAAAVAQAAAAWGAAQAVAQAEVAARGAEVAAARAAAGAARPAECARAEVAARGAEVAAARAAAAVALAAAAAAAEVAAEVEAGAGGRGEVERAMLCALEGVLSIGRQAEPIEISRVNIANQAFADARSA